MPFPMWRRNALAPRPSLFSKALSVVNDVLPAHGVDKNLTVKLRDEVELLERKLGDEHKEIAKKIESKLLEYLSSGIDGRLIDDDVYPKSFDVSLICDRFERDVRSEWEKDFLEQLHQSGLLSKAMKVSLAITFLLEYTPVLRLMKEHASASVVKGVAMCYLIWFASVPLLYIASFIRHKVYEPQYAFLGRELQKSMFAIAVQLKRVRDAYCFHRADTSNTPLVPRNIDELAENLFYEATTLNTAQERIEQIFRRYLEFTSVKTADLDEAFVETLVSTKVDKGRCELKSSFDEGVFTHELIVSAISALRASDVSNGSEQKLGNVVRHRVGF